MNTKGHDVIRVYVFLPKKGHLIPSILLWILAKKILMLFMPKVS